MPDPCDEELVRKFEFAEEVVNGHPRDQEREEHLL